MKNMFSLFAGLMLFFSCSKDSGNANQDNYELNPQELYPIIMIHGMLASGDTYANFSMYFTSNGYPKSYLYSFDWNSLGSASNTIQNELDVLVNEVLAKTQKTKVILMGHSAGGGVGYTYCSDAVRSQKVAKYIHIGSNPQNKPAGPNGEIPTMNIFSKGDKIVSGSEIQGAENVIFEDLDHYEVATSFKSFEKVFSFSTGGKLIKNKEIIRRNAPVISGKVLSLGENKPTLNLTVKLYYIHPETGERKGAPISTFKPDDKGSFDPITIHPEEYLEFEVTSTQADFRTIYYYFEPMIHENPFVYLRIFPPPGSFAGILLSALPKSDNQSVIAIFSANKAIIHQRDDCKVQNITLSNATLCSPANSTIALFLYDDGNQQSSGNPHALFSVVPFLKGADMYFQTNESAPVDLFLNTKKLTVRNYKSGSEGVVIAVFK